MRDAQYNFMGSILSSPNDKDFFARRALIERLKTENPSTLYMALIEAMHQESITAWNIDAGLLLVAATATVAALVAKKMT